MDENKDMKAKNVDDLDGIVMQIRAANRSSAAEIMIGSFKFTCDTMTGNVKNVLHKQGSINYGVGAESISKYEYQIQRALEIAAKMDLIEKIKSLKDEKLNTVIARHAVNPENINEQSVNTALAKIFLEVKISVIAKFGLMAPKQTDQQKAVHAALKTIGIDDIATYHHVDLVMSDVNSRLTRAEPKQPTPKLTG